MINFIIKLLITITTFIFVNSIYGADSPAKVQLADIQEIIRDNGSEPISIDPSKVESNVGGNIVVDLFEGLVSKAYNGAINPGQAERWTISKDRKTFTFFIRKNACWSNGDPITAEDFVFSFRRAVDPKTASRYAWFLETAAITNAKEIIKGEKKPESLGVKAINSKTLQFSLQLPIPYFMQLLSHPIAFPIHKKSIERYGNKWTRPQYIVSNGAYKLKSWIVNEKIVLERNNLYWNNHKTIINKVTFLPIQSSTASLNRYKSGEIDITSNIPIERYAALKKEIPDHIRTTPLIAIYYYAFNTTIKPFNDVRVRKALSYGINRDNITQNLLAQGQKPAYTFTPETINHFTPPKLPYSQITQEQRNKMAIKWLQEAGYSKKNPLAVTILYNTSESHKKIAIAIAQMWKHDLGVNVTLENQEWKIFLDNGKNKNFQITRVGWVGSYNDASSILDVNTSNHGANLSGFNNKKYNQLMHQSRLIDNDKARAEIYKQAEQLLAEEVPNAPIYQYVSTRLVKPYVGGYPDKNLEDILYTKDLYIKKHQHKNTVKSY